MRGSVGGGGGQTDFGGAETLGPDHRGNRRIRQVTPKLEAFCRGQRWKRSAPCRGGGDGAHTGDRDARQASQLLPFSGGNGLGTAPVKQSLEGVGEAHRADQIV